MGTIAKGEFSKQNGSKVRIMRDENGQLLGTITKLDGGEGYRIFRMKDQKIRTKKLLADAYKSIARSN